MSSYTLKQLPVILRNFELKDVPKVLQIIDSEYAKGAESYNQFLDKCRHINDDAYPSYLE